MTYKELCDIRDMLQAILTWDVCEDLMLDDEVNALIKIVNRELDKHE